MELNKNQKLHVINGLRFVAKNDSIIIKINNFKAKQSSSFPSTYLIMGRKLSDESNHRKIPQCMQRLQKTVIVWCTCSTFLDASGLTKYISSMTVMLLGYISFQSKVCYNICDWHQHSQKIYGRRQWKMRKHNNTIANYEMNRVIDCTKKNWCKRQQENMDRSDQQKITWKENGNWSRI